MVKVNSSTLVGMISSNSSSRWPLCNTVRHIKSFVTQLGVSVAYTSREMNSLVDALTSLQLRTDAIFTSETSLPPRARSTLHLDKIQTPFICRCSVRV